MTSSVLVRWSCSGFRLLAVAFLLGCGNPTPRSAAEHSLGHERVKPPFSVRGNLDGLFLQWFDEHGAHAAETREEIPKDKRQYVRVDSLALPPEQRLDPEYFYVADLRTPAADGSYNVYKVRRDAFEELLASKRGGGDTTANTKRSERDARQASREKPVIIYGAEWCGACHSAASFFRAHAIRYVEKDIEKDPSARSEMLQKLRSAGLSADGIPIIDFRGFLVQGFDPERLQHLIDGQGTVI